MNSPMGPHAGRVLLNGNAENPERFISLALKGLGDLVHREPAVHRADQFCLITASWGRGERGDAPLRRRLSDRGEVINLGVYEAFRTFLHKRPVVRSLFDEHDDAWNVLMSAYSDENDSLVVRLRQAFESVSDQNPGAMGRVLRMGARFQIGPQARPINEFLQKSAAGRVIRALDGLRNGDQRHANELKSLWEHFHLAAGLDFDPLWVEMREKLREQLLGSVAVLLTGGEPAYLLTSLRFFQLESVLTEALRRGTGFFGSSAGAMVLGRRIVIFHDRRTPRQEFEMFDCGMNMVRGFQVFPHVNDRVQTEDQDNLTYLAARFNSRSCVGLNAGSTMSVEMFEGGWRAVSRGDEEVVVFGDDGTKLRFAPGEVIEI